MTENERLDALTALTALRPDGTTLAAEWSPAERAALRERLGTDADHHTPRFVSPTRHRRGRLALAGLVAAGAAAATVAGLVLPGGSPGGPNPAAAAELRRLAVIAGEQGGAVGPREYVHRVLAEEQTAQDPAEPPAPGDTRIGGVDHRPLFETWRMASGVKYSKNAERGCLVRSRYTGADARGGNYEDLTGPQLAQLPTDVDGLARFIDDHPSGDNRGTSNRYIAVGDLVRSGLASPELRAAGLRVLAMTAGISVRTGVRDDRGRPATAVDHAQGDGVETLFFDPSTSTVLEEREGRDLRGPHYAGIVLVDKIVDRLPDLPRC